MFTVNFAVGSADDARIAADVCDFLAERMSAGAAAPSRTPRPRASNKPPVEVPNDKPDAAALYAALGGTAPVEIDVPGIAAVADPAALVVALAGSEPVTPKVEPEAAAVIDSPENRLERCRAIAKARGGKWLGDTMKKLGITNSMSTWSAEVQEQFFAEDVTA